MNFSPVTRASAVLMLFAVAILSSCGITVESRTDLLTAGPWTFQSYTNPDADPVDVAFATAFLSLAQFDYADNGTYTITFSDTLFDPTNGTWEFSDDALMITHDKGTDDETVSDVVDLTKETFSYSYTDSTGVNTLTWKQ